MPPQPLAPRQESRLIGHLDTALLHLARNLNNRHAPNSALPSLPSYLHALADLNAVVLAVPPVAPSAQLRAAYALQLLSLLPDGVAGYGLPPRSQRGAVWARLGRWDEEWVAVVRGVEWDSRSGKAKEEEGGGRRAELTGTERVRLRSLIGDVRAALEGILGPTQFKPLEFNPFVPGSESEAKLGDHPRPELTGRVEGEVAIEEGTPSLVSDAETGSEVGMDLDTEVEATSEQLGADDVVIKDEMDDSDDDDEFEEVDVPELDTAVDDYPSYPTSITEPDSNAAFSISFQGPPIPLDAAQPPTDAQHPSVPPSRGFDPDAEYPDSEPEEEEEDEDEYEPGVEVAENEAAMAVELGKARRVFERTLAALEEVERGGMQG